MGKGHARIPRLCTCICMYDVMYVSLLYIHMPLYLQMQKVHVEENVNVHVDANVNVDADVGAVANLQMRT